MRILVLGGTRFLGRAFVEAALGTGRLQPAAAEERRRDPVEGRGLMQPHEAVRVEPMPARAVAAIHQRDGDVRVRREGVDERHPHRSRADDQVVDVDDRLHALI